MVFLVEMPTIHFGGLAGNGLDLDADFHTFPSAFNGLVVVFYTRHNPDIHELQEKKIAKKPTETYSQMVSTVFGI